ncbi:hypothetical protein GUJ93_ZPchr0001g31050 [Zizania palustris]|uniref:Uncharacterized protein n=1 Tax=Zizania palustris TaxID=103762 RepID=A0A8J5RTA5_ZIZPA|nr:hypothetical protein GUJ93_ZPchr0001g31050 [Zizania palustris]
MEEAKAAAYYDELNRKGEGARRFKQGLGFSSSDSQTASFPSKPTATSSSFLSGFVRAGATPAPPPKPTKPPPSQPPETSSLTGRHSRSPSPSRHRHRSRSPSRSRRHRSRSRERRRRSRSKEKEDRRASRRRSRSRSRSRSSSRRSGRSSHSEDRRDRHGDRRRDDGRGRHESSKGRSSKDRGKVDYSRLIEGYDRMTPAERVKAKMKLQLSETASKDSTLGNATVGWERFEFNKDAPLDEDDNDVEVANDDASLVKHIGKSFRLSAVESKHEDIVRAAHDEAIFGVPTYSIVDTETTEAELQTNDHGEKAEDVEAEPSSSLISDKVLATQKGSWRERAQKLRQNSIS